MSAGLNYTVYCLSLISAQPISSPLDLVILIQVNSLKLIKAPWQYNLVLACLLRNIANNVARVDR